MVGSLKVVISSFRVEPLGIVVSPFRPTSRKRGGDRTTTLRRRDVDAVGPSCLCQESETIFESSYHLFLSAVA